MRKYDLTVNDKSFSITVRNVTSERAELEIRGTLYNVRINDVVAEGGVRTSELKKEVRGTPLPTKPSSTAPSRTAGNGSLLAPIPGQILTLLVKPGDVVKSGQHVLKMEAMKMENAIVAHMDGTVAAISVKVGDTVSQGQELLVIE